MIQSTEGILLPCCRRRTPYSFAVSPCYRDARDGAGRGGALSTPIEFVESTEQLPMSATGGQDVRRWCSSTATAFVSTRSLYARYRQARADSTLCADLRGTRIRRRLVPDMIADDVAAFVQHMV
jgi:hypothetical protein